MRDHLPHTHPWLLRLGTTSTQEFHCCTCCLLPESSLHVAGRGALDQPSSDPEEWVIPGSSPCRGPLWGALAISRSPIRTSPSCPNCAFRHPVLASSLPPLRLLLPYPMPRGSPPQISYMCSNPCLRDRWDLNWRPGTGTGPTRLTFRTGPHCWRGVGQRNSGESRHHSY